MTYWEGKTVREGVALRSAETHSASATLTLQLCSVAFESMRCKPPRSASLLRFSSRQAFRTGRCIIACIVVRPFISMHPKSKRTRHPYASKIKTHLVRHGCVEQVPRSRVAQALGLPCGAARVKQEQEVLGRHDLGGAHGPRVDVLLREVDVATGRHGHLVLCALADTNLQTQIRQKQ